MLALWGHLEGLLLFKVGIPSFDTDLVCAILLGLLLFFEGDPSFGMGLDSVTMRESCRC